MINLTEPVEVQVQDVVLKVYPVSLSRSIVVSERIEKLASITEVKAQVAEFLDILVEVLKNGNPEITKEKLEDVVTMSAGMQIIQIALGNFNAK